ncbi:unnamed protein product [Candida verbasci]|uniref:Inner kinetochore subunit AME1 domain-containing protein n=1 Tax=Candida verbasci TaxID=1227364 RepID=A0A9W4TW98_9ASCO|nr:unnamed protein product [Candida verbasci]
MNRVAKREARLRGSGTRILSRARFSINFDELRQNFTTAPDFELPDINDNYDQIEQDIIEEEEEKELEKEELMEDVNEEIEHTPENLQRVIIPASPINQKPSETEERLIKRYTVSVTGPIDSFIPVHEPSLHINYPQLKNVKKAIMRTTQMRTRLLDVLRFFIDTFEPKDLNEEQKVINSKFKHYLLTYIDQLRGLANNVEVIGKKIYSVQRKKYQVRKDILELRTSHTKVGSTLNQLRNKLKNKKREQQDVKLMYNQILNTKEHVEFFEKTTPKLSSQVKLQLNTLKSLVNPQMGISSKLKDINSKLDQLHEKID